MTESLAPFTVRARLAACFAAAGLLFAATPAIAQTRLPPPAYGTADQQQDRVEDLQRQLTQAEGENENLQRQLNEANREITRLRAMVGELSSVNQQLSTPPAEGAQAPAAGAAPAPQGAARPGGSAEVAPPTLNEAQRAATGTLGSVPGGAAPATPVMDAGDAYSRARELLVDGNYAEAEAAFGDFLERYPRAETAADARFWFAFTLLARNNYQDAAANFVRYLQDTPQGPRAAEAQVRLGMALAGMEQRTQACQAFGSLTRRYPNAPRNVRDLATREARAAQCSA